MRRYLLGVTLLVLLPLLSLPVSRALNAHHTHLGDQLNQAAQLFVRGSEEEGNVLLQRAFRQWEENRHFTAAFIHHAPLDTIDSDFAATEVIDGAALAERCALLAAQFYALADSTGLNWWDVL